MLLRAFLSVGLLAALLGTAACSSSSSSSAKPSSSSASEAAPTPARVETSLGGLPPEVAVKVDELPPGQEVEEVVLVDPLGNEVPASELTSAPPSGSRARASTGGVGFGIGGGSSGIRVGPSISLGVPLGGSESSRGRSGGTIAKIPVPDPDAYFRESDEWTVMVYTRDAEGRAYSYQMPAPEFPGDRKVSTVAPEGGGESGF